MTLVKVDATVADFNGLFDALFADDGSSSLLLLFLADRDPSSGLTRCPDCNVSEPVIYSKLDSMRGRDMLLLRAFVSDMPTWRDPANPWRVDPLFGLMGVPTLLRWDDSKGASMGRLEGDEARVADKIHALLS